MNGARFLLILFLCKESFAIISSITWSEYNDSYVKNLLAGCQSMMPDVKIRSCERIRIGFSLGVALKK